VGISGSKGRHLAVVAAVSSGKTTYLITTLSLHDGSAFIIDADAQIYNAIGRRLGAGGNGIVGKGNQVALLDPFRLSNKGRSASWNPFDEIDAAVARSGHDAAVDTAKTLAEALIRTVEHHNEWVYNEARFFMTSLVLYVWLYEPPDRRNLVRLRELLTVGLRGVADERYDPFDVLLYEMKQKTDFDGIVAKGAAMMEASQGADGKNPPRASAIDQTSWLDLPQIAAVSKHSDFHCEDLEKGRVSLFVVASITDIQTKLSGWVRCLTIMTMHAFEKCQERPKTPCLFCIDEAPSLRIETLPTFAATFRKYGGRLLTITQNLERLAEAYPKSWGGFLGDAEATVWLANDHKGTLEYLSSMLGTATRAETVKPKLWRRLVLKEKPHTQQVERPLIYTHQLREFLDNNVVVTRSGKRPMRLKPAPYYKELPVFHYEADRFYGEKPMRRSFREAWLWACANAPGYVKRLRAYTGRSTRLLR
jgi:type IV secretory pathway TraG/TraD family ATPase VirD4